MELRALCWDLGNPKTLVRERALKLFEESLETNASDVELASEHFELMLESDVYEDVYGGLKGSLALLSKNLAPDSLRTYIRDHANDLIRHEDFKVREVMGQVLGEMCRLEGISIYHNVKARLLQVIFEAFLPDLEEVENEFKKEAVMKGGAGWQNLESALKCLIGCMNGLKTGFESEVDDNFWEALSKSIEHPNRYIRESGQYLLKDLCESSSQDFIASVSHKLVPIIASGLEDSMCQVRYAASQAVRSYLIKSGERAREFEAVLLPRMCINRYYVAEGVKIYSHDTWKLYCGDQGRMKIANLCEAVVEFYIDQASAESHAVREAACMCIAELVSKVAEMAGQRLEVLVPLLISALLECFRDESWAVRDRACVATSEVVSAFPDISARYLPELKELWFAHLADNVISVRKNTAWALATAAKIYKSRPENFIPEISSYLHSNFSKLRGQREFEQTHTQPPQPTNDSAYSCENLSPELQSFDHGFARERFPWEITNGCIYLISEIGTFEAELSASFMREIGDLALLNEYKSAHHFREYLWKEIPSLAKNLGKQVFKQDLEYLLDPMFRDTSSKSENLRATSEECIRELSKLIGPSIFKGRVEMKNASYLPILSKVLSNNPVF